MYHKVAAAGSDAQDTQTVSNTFTDASLQRPMDLGELETATA